MDCAASPRPSKTPWPPRRAAGDPLSVAKLRLVPAVNFSVRLAPDNSAYVGYNDGRRAWSDERGDIQQSWHQKELGMRRTNGGGVAIFDGCVVGIQGDVLVEVSEGWEATPLRFAIGEGLDADQGITIKPKQ